jgi:hypothetical protein
MIMLHPNCQVVDHVPEANWPALLRFFKRGADIRPIANLLIRLAQDKKILGSHAAEKVGIEEVDEKGDIYSVVCKDPTRTTKVLREECDLNELIHRCPELRFFMSIRNPVHTMMSLYGKPAHLRYVFTVDEMNEDPLSRYYLCRRYVLNTIDDFDRFESQLPSRFYSVREEDFDRSKLVRLAEFLQIPPYEDWLDRAEELFVIDPKGCARYEQNHLQFQKMLWRLRKDPGAICQVVERVVEDDDAQIVEITEDGNES